METKKIKRYSIIAVLGILLLVFLFNAPGVVTIKTENSANISMTDGKDGEFKKIGTTKTTRFFFKKPTVFYVSAETDGKQTIQSFKPKRFTFKTIELELKDTVPAQKISDGAVVDAFFDSNQGRGIAYGQNIVVDFKTDSESSNNNPEIAGLPYVKKIVWQDINNFVYLSSPTIGQFSGGVDKGDSEVASVTSGDVAINSDTITESGAPRITDISMTAGKPLVLLSSTNIFTSSNLGTNLDGITSFEKEAGETSIFTTENNIYKVTYPDLTDDHDAKQTKAIVTLDKFSYSGEWASTIKLDDASEVVSIAEKDNTVYVLTQFGIHTIKDERVTDTSLYFANPADMVIYKGRIVVLGKDGLWQLNENDASFQLLYRFTEFGTGLKGSMSVSPNNVLIFGTTTINSDSDKSATFSTSF